MRKVLLSADSTCDLSPELKERYHVHYYPFHVIFRGVDHLDNVDIRPEDIFAGYREDGSLPTTSAINVQEYLDYFAPFVERGYDIVHLNLGTCALERACARRRGGPSARARLRDRQP